MIVMPLYMTVRLKQQPINGWRGRDDRFYAKSVPTSSTPVSGTFLYINYLINYNL